MNYNRISISWFFISSMMESDSKKHPFDVLKQCHKYHRKLELQGESYNRGYSSLVFVGSHFGGKTSIINRFIDKSDHQKQSNYEETIALDYRFAKSSDKICNIWELGNELLFFDLISFAINHNTVRNSSAILVLDLTRPNELAILAETCLDRLQQHLESITKNDTELQEELQRLTNKRSVWHNSDEIKEANRAKSSSTLLLIPLTIIGTKYDEFQNMDPEVKKQITKYLRCISYTRGGQLFFYSNKSETLTKRINSVLNALAFESLSFDTKDRSKPSVSTNISKPIMIPFGYDNPNRIGLNENNGKELDETKQQFHRMFPQIDPERLYRSTLHNDPRFDSNFAEAELDKILEFKYMLMNSS
ncbi:Cytoplasmic dynein 2 light intermediate chain 1 [Sarcoptes scabiei]|uniref:Cytoplasmic dynein 2 light intermediate chain 1 n=2 Tax=Sarcoptes scabiei TaxID=52283 RepID=A0A834VDJ5_SARSC|nr:Cytoplasmic dynein 2 light intermediate chain 1 [Sarcoptes scabiei]